MLALPLRLFRALSFASLSSYLPTYPICLATETNWNLASPYCFSLIFFAFVLRYTSCHLFGKKTSFVVHAITVTAVDAPYGKQKERQKYKKRTRLF